MRTPTYTMLEFCLSALGSTHIWLVTMCQGRRRERGGYCIIASRLNTLEQHPPNIKLIIAIHCGTVAWNINPLKTELWKRGGGYLRECASGSGRGGFALSVPIVFGYRCRGHLTLPHTQHNNNNEKKRPRYKSPVVVDLAPTAGGDDERRDFQGKAEDTPISR